MHDKELLKGFLAEGRESGTITDWRLKGDGLLQKGRRNGLEAALGAKEKSYHTSHV